MVIVTEANWDLFYTFEQPVLPLLKLFKCKTVAFGRIHDIRKQLIKKVLEMTVYRPCELVLDPW